MHAASYAGRGRPDLRAEHGAEPRRERIDDPRRTAAASSSVSVRSGEPKATRKASDRLPSPTCAPRYSSNTAAVAQLGPPPASRIAASSSAAGTSSSTTNARSCRTSGTADVAVRRPRRARARRARRGRARTRPTRPRAPSGAARRTSPRAVRAALPGWRSGSSPRSIASSSFSARVELLDRPLRLGEAALDDAGDVPALVRQLLAARAIDARDLEQRDVGVARRRRSGRAASTRLGDERRAQRGRLAARAAPAAGSRPRRRSVGVYASEKPQPTSTSSTTRRSCCQRRQPPERDVAPRQRERDLVQHEARDLLDEVDLARHVARAPRRHAIAVARRSKPSFARIAACSLAGTSRPSTARRALGAQRTITGGSAARPARPSPPSSAHRRARRSAASRCARPCPRGTGRRPSPSGSSPRCAAPSRSDVRRIPTGSKFAASSSTDVVVSRRPRSPRRP